jgi:hypothetical protein
MGCADARECVRPGSPGASLIVQAVVFVFLGCLTVNGGARAQSGGQKPLIVASKFIHLAPGAEVPLDVTVWPPEAIQPGSTLMIRGLPARITLAQGRQVSPGVWGLPADIAAPVKLMAPVGTEGVSELTIMLVAANGSLITEFRATLVIETSGRRLSVPETAASAPKKLEAAAAPAAPERPAVPEPPPVVENKPNPMAIPVPPPAARAAMTAEDRNRALKLMEKGDKSLASGNVTVARLCYQNAVEIGWAPAAIALGGTYDPAELQQLNVVGGLQPDLQLAKKWYTVAQELGAGDAGKRLQRLGAK